MSLSAVNLTTGAMVSKRQIVAAAVTFPFQGFMLRSQIHNTGAQPIYLSKYLGTQYARDSTEYGHRFYAIEGHTSIDANPSVVEGHLKLSPSLQRAVRSSEDSGPEEATSMRFSLLWYVPPSATHSHDAA